jgi:hypothetical protein
MDGVRAGFASAAATVLVFSALGLAADGTGATRSVAQDGEAPAKTQGLRADLAVFDGAKQELKNLHQAIVVLANSAMAEFEQLDRPEDDPEIQQSKVAAAEADAEYAKLKREIASIALKEYDELTSVQEKTAAEAQLKEARDALERARKASESAKDYLDRVKLSATGRVYDLVEQFRCEDRVEIAELGARNAELRMKLAEHRVQSLGGLKQRSHTDELRSQVAGAEADELLKKSQVAVATAVLRRLTQSNRDQAKNPAFLPVPRRILGVLDQAIPIEEQVRALLEPPYLLAKDDEPRRRQVRDSINRLRALVETAIDESDRQESALLKATVVWRGTIVPSHLPVPIAEGISELSPSKIGTKRVLSTEPAPPAPADAVAFATQKRYELKTLHDLLAARAAQELPKHPYRQGPQVNLAQLGIEATGAGTTFKHAELTRLNAELAVTAYQQGTVISDERMAKAGIQRADDGLAKARTRIQVVRDRLAKIRDASDGSVLHISFELNFVDEIARAEEREQKATGELREAKTKLKALVEYTKPRRIKELQTEVANARAEEHRKHAEAKLLELKLKRLSERAKAWESESDAKRLEFFDVFKQALEVEEKTRTKLHDFAQKGQHDDALEHEVDDGLNELQRLINRAPWASDIAESARLRERVHAMAVRYPAAK